MTEISVTAEMVSAGLGELGEHSFAEDPAYILECVYRAMAYAADDAAKADLQQAARAALGDTK